MFHVPWKKIFTFGLGIAASGLIPIPGLPIAIEAIANAVEHVFGPGSGTTKLQKATIMLDGLVSAAIDLNLMDADDVARYQHLKEKCFTNYVTWKNLEADTLDKLKVAEHETVETFNELQAFISEVKHRQVGN